MTRSQSMFTVSDAWRKAYPGAAIGVLAMQGVANPEGHAGLNARKEELENELRARFSGHDRAALKSIPVIRAYNDYYKRFGKSYHVQLQLESIVHKGKSIPRVAALVESMFMAELKNQMLTAGHDLDALEMPVGVDIAQGDEHYTRINGQDQQMKPGDMMISDACGIMSSIVYGPDQRTRITPETERVLFTVYVSPGIDADTVRAHLEDMRSNVLVVSPEARTEVLEVYRAE
ncbi:phenylalanine--tRNA ligase beta subunit-related protein [Candidatus Bipolaricaulota bacterium]